MLRPNRFLISNMCIKFPTVVPQTAPPLKVQVRSNYPGSQTVKEGANTTSDEGGGSLGIVTQNVLLLLTAIAVANWKMNC